LESIGYKGLDEKSKRMIFTKRKDPGGNGRKYLPEEDRPGLVTLLMYSYFAGYKGIEGLAF
jgi:hypothetical protein